jgi:hypothetical protein
MEKVLKMYVVWDMPLGGSVGMKQLPNYAASYPRKQNFHRRRRRRRLNLKSCTICINVANFLTSEKKL